MQPRVHLVTLGVADLPAARAFYARLGWREAKASNARIAFFDLGCLALALYPTADLAADAQIAPSHGAGVSVGFRGVTLAHNVASPTAVDTLLAEAVAAGATLLKPGTKASWGGYSGYFADPEGHVWEVAHNPFCPIDDDGYFRLAEAD